MATDVLPDLLPLSYSVIFQERGSAYDIAMQRHPRARLAEFTQLIAAAELEPGMHLGDVPAGGGYLAAHLPPGVAWHGHEPCASFTNHSVQGTSAGGGPLLPLPWGDQTLDVALSLAGVHHLDDKVPLLRDLLRVVRPGGRLVLSDVAENSAVARFLDGFVGAYNSTGHEGAFLCAGTLDELAAAGWTVRSTVANHFTWDFDSLADMADFTRHLFDVVKAPSDDAILAAIRRDLGITDLPSGRVGMNWSLQTIVCEKPPAGSATK